MIVLYDEKPGKDLQNTKLLPVVLSLSGIIKDWCFLHYIVLSFEIIF